MNMAGKGHFFYHGDGTNPNYDRTSVPDGGGSGESGGVANTNLAGQGTIDVQSISLSINGTERHASLDKGIDTHYLRERLLPMLHSNSSQREKQLMGHTGSGTDMRFNAEQQYGMAGSKNIFVYPFSLNPEGSNPSGAVNFSKVSHAKLTLHLKDASGMPRSSPLYLFEKLPAHTGGFQVDVYALYYNWLQIKDGRALLSFA